jgi:hypothetical protein
MSRFEKAAELLKEFEVERCNKATEAALELKIKNAKEAAACFELILQLTNKLQLDGVKWSTQPWSLHIIFTLYVFSFPVFR